MRGAGRAGGDEAFGAVEAVDEALGGETVLEVEVAADQVEAVGGAVLGGAVLDVGDGGGVAGGGGDVEAGAVEDDVFDKDGDVALDHAVAQVEVGANV